MVRLIAADMDGTLLNSQRELSPRVFPLIRQLKRLGIRFVVSSGRQYYTLLQQFKPVENDVIFSSENGAMVLEHGASLFVDRIDPEAIRRCVLRIREIPGTHPVLCGTNGAYYESVSPLFLEHFNMYYKSSHRRANVLNALEEDTIFKIAVFDEKGAESNCYPALLKQDDEGLATVLSGKLWVDLMNPGVNKGTAISMLQKIYEISPEESMAFGDYLNDCEMMEHCYYSYAMENAHPDLKKICRFTAKSNDEGGVVEAILSYLRTQNLPLDELA